MGAGFRQFGIDALAQTGIMGPQHQKKTQQ